MPKPRSVFLPVWPLQLSAAALVGLGTLFSAGCAGGPVGSSLQQSLEADPQLEEQDGLFGQASEPNAEETPGAGQADSAPETAPLSTSSQDSDPASGRADEPGATMGGSTRPSSSGTSAAAPSASNQSALADVPDDLQPYVEDLMALNLFSRAAVQKPNSSSSVPFEPNQPITRGQYAQWLLTANNLFYSDQPSQKIRAANASATPAFQDVPTDHPYFGAIQGLAEAGLIPSALTGNSTAVNFRPDAPLTRESLVLWKVPLDIRTALPTASVDAVKATWGFQDAADIEPLALRAVLADHQTGDFANTVRAFGYTTLFQPQKAVTQAEAAATLWRFGAQTEGISAQELLERPQDNRPASE